MAQRLKCLLHKHEERDCSRRRPPRKLLWCLGLDASVEQGDKRFPGLMTSKSSELRNTRFSGRPCFKSQGDRSDTNSRLVASALGLPHTSLQHTLCFHVAPSAGVTLSEVGWKQHWGLGLPLESCQQLFIVRQQPSVLSALEGRRAFHEAVLHLSLNM